LAPDVELVPAQADVQKKWIDFHHAQSPLPLEYKMADFLRTYKCRVFNQELL